MHDLEPLHLTDPSTGEAWAAFPVAWDMILSTKVRPATTPNLDDEAAKAEPPAKVPGQPLPSYKRGHVVFQGIQVAIENPRGSVRSGVTPQGRPWSNTLAHHYGFIKRTWGADGDAVDCFIGPDMESERVWVIDQIDPHTEAFDEHKVLLGFSSEEEARKGYLDSYQRGWKGLGAITAWTIDDLKDWLREGDTMRPITKASPVPAGAVWRTVHPQGPGSKGHPILVMPVHGHKHAFRVIGGAGGKLNGLRLHITKDPEAYKEESRQRAKEARAQEQERLAKMTPEERAAHKESLAAAKGQRRQAEAQFAEDILGPDPEAGRLLQEEGQDPKEAAKEAAKRHRERLAAAHGAVAEAKRKLMLDVEAREQAGVATTGGLSDHGLDVDDIVSEAGVGGPGYRRALAQRASAAGLTAEKLVEKVQDIRTRRAAANRAPGEPVDQPAAEPHPEAPEATQGQDGGTQEALPLGEQQANIEAHVAVKELDAQRAGAMREAVKSALARNEKLAAMLKARQELRQAYKDIQKKDTVFKEGFQMVGGEEEPGQNLEQSLYEEMLTGHMVGFLREVGEIQPEESAMDPAGVGEVEGMHAARGAGAWDALHEFALAAVGQGMLERDTVEALGPEGSARLIARGLRRDFEQDDQREILRALEEHHLKDQERLPEAIADAESMRAKANQIQADLAENPRDLSLAIELQKNRLEALKDARRTLGGTLGRLEARAALIAALRSPDQDTLTLPLGAMSPEKAVQTAAAMGLQDQDYKIDHEKGEALIHITAQGQDRLVQPINTAALHERDLAMAIKGGQMDEPGYLPAGFADRSDSRYDHPIQEAPQFRTQLQLHPEMPPEQIHQALEDHVGSRVADGERPQDILDDLWNGQTLATSVPEQALPHYAAALQQLFPMRKARLDKEGQQVYQTANDGSQVPVFDNVPFSDLEEHFGAMAKSYLQRAGHTGDLDLAAQRVDPDHRDFGEAVHRALAEDPRLAAAFTPSAELDSEGQQRIRDWFYREVKGIDPDKERDTRAAQRAAAGPKEPATAGGEAEKSPDIHPDSRSAVEDALADEGLTGVKESDWAKALPAAGPEPEKFEMDMFGEQTESPIWQDWKQRAIDSLRAVKQGKADELEANTSSYQGRPAAQALAAAPAPSAWNAYVQSMGGLIPAQQAIQAQMKGKFATSFQSHYQKVNGRGLKLGKVALDHQDRFNAATMDPEQLKAIRAEQAKLVSGLRTRDTRGQYVEGGVLGQVDEARQRLQAARAGQASLFQKQEEPGLRATLGQTLEAQVRAHLPGYASAFEGMRKGTGVHERVRMDGDKALQQRGVKAIVNLKRLGLFLGPGSGKTPIMLGGLTEIHKAGKLKKAILAVPSIVQGQFAAEGLRFLDPNGGFKMHARPGESWEERLAAYQDPGQHAVVITHQALRDDTLRILGEHLGRDEQATHDFVMQTPKPELAKAVKEAFGARGIDFNALMVDEAHSALDRDGKPDSTFSRIMNAHSRNMDYMVSATGNPLKNDVSEIYSDLNHLDPEHNPDEGKDEFMRRFGGEASIAKRSLAQQLSRYWFNGRVEIPTQAHRLDQGIPLTPEQEQKIRDLDFAMGKLRTKDPDTVRWAKALKPEAFEQAPEDQHQAIAQDVARSVGTYRETAMNRIINLDPAGGKMQEHVRICKQAIAEGKPVVIFAHNLEAVEAIHRNLEAAGIRVASLTGKDGTKEKDAKLGAYQRGEQDVLVMSDAGSTGANLQRGKVMIHHDQGLTAMTMQQRDARIHRIGQTGDVEIHHLLADHQWERTNAARVKRKGILGSLFESPEDYLDDQGIAGELRALRVRRNQGRAA